MNTHPLNLRNLLKLIPLFSLALLTGCVGIGRNYEGNDVLLDALAKIEKGKTTRAEVLELLGAPLRVDKVNITALTEQSLARYEGEKLTLQIDPALFDEIYVYERKQTNTFFVFTFLFNYYRSDERSDRLAVFFDRDGKVIGTGWTPGRKEL